MSDDTESSALPVSWDEAREALLVVLLVCAVLRMLGPLSGFIDERWGVFSDDLAELPRSVGSWFLENFRPLRMSEGNSCRAASWPKLSGNAVSWCCRGFSSRKARADRSCQARTEPR